jgi:hypothetical protein
MGQRHASPNTVAAYRDSFRLPLPLHAGDHRQAPFPARPSRPGRSRYRRPGKELFGSTAISWRIRGRRPLPVLDRIPPDDLKPAVRPLPDAASLPLAAFHDSIVGHGRDLHGVTLSSYGDRGHNRVRQAPSVIRFMIRLISSTLRAPVEFTLVSSKWWWRRVVSNHRQHDYELSLIVDPRIVFERQHDDVVLAVSVVLLWGGSTFWARRGCMGLAARCRRPSGTKAGRRPPGSRAGAACWRSRTGRPRSYPPRRLPSAPRR